MNTAVALFAAFKQLSAAASAMSLRKIGPLYAATLFTLLAVAGAQSELALAAEHTVEGSWVIQVTPAPESQIPPFVNLGTFTKDGHVINSDPVEGAALGEWIKVGPRQFGVTLMGFTNFEGNYLLNKVRAVLDMNGAGDTFTGPFRAEVFNTDGTVAFAFEGTVRGTRFGVESP